MASKRFNDGMIVKIKNKLRSIKWKLMKGFVYEKVYNNFLLKQLLSPFPNVLKTPQLKCNPKSEVEIHSLVCHRHLYMYLLAIKSFLRFYNNVGVVVHDDGSLSSKDKKILSAHIKGIKIIKKDFADKKLNSFLKNKPNCRYFRDVYPNAKQLFDYNILSNKNKLISFDSDLIFLKKPGEVVRWMQNGGRDLVYLHRTNLFESLHAGLFKKNNIKQLGNLNCGFMCYYKDAVDFGYIEKLIKKLKNKQGWRWSQAYYNATFYFCGYNLKHLNKNHYTIFDWNNYSSNTKMIHFISPTRFGKWTYFKLARKTIKELMVFRN